MRSRFRIHSFALCLFAFLVSCSCAKNDYVNLKVEYDFSLHLDEADIEAQNAKFVTPYLVSIPTEHGKQENRWGIFQHSTSKIHFHEVMAGSDSVLSFSYGLNPESWDKGGDGVLFRILVSLAGKQPEEVWSHYIDPKNNPSDQKLFHQTVKLKPFLDEEAQTVTFTFETQPGPENNAESDWSFWSEPHLTSKGVRSPHQTHDQTNVILITIDTCRFDYLGCYGNEWMKTPAIDHLAQEGTLFEKAYSASSTTNPSHVSIFTSMQPIQHGVIGNDYKVANSVPRLSQIFSEMGYRTGASISVRHLDDEISGLGKWFEEYNHRSSKWLQNLGYALENLTRDGRTTTSAAIEWLEKVHNDPYFLWIHYYDPHAPYEAANEFHRAYYRGNPSDPQNKSMEHVLFHNLSQDAYAWTKPYTDLEYFKKEYGAEISSVDAQIGRLMQALQRLKVDQNTLIVLTGDHGESLGEHEIYFDHFALFNEEIQVPLIFYYPQKIPRGVRVPSMASHIDIAPTILDVVGEKDNYLAKNTFDGRSLQPYWKNPTVEDNRILTSQGLLFTSMAGWDQRYKVVWELRDVSYHDRFSMKMDRVWIFDHRNDPHDESPIGCFYWGDNNARKLFYEHVHQEHAKIEHPDEKVKEDLKLRQLLMFMHDKLKQKKNPTLDQLKQWLASRYEDTFIKEEYLSQDDFLPRILSILQTLKADVSVPPLEERLKKVIDISALSNDDIRSVPINNREELEALGY